MKVRTTEELNVARALIRAKNLFFAHGYQGEKVVYDILWKEYDTRLFAKVAFCRGLVDILEYDLQAPNFWFEKIMKKWIEERALLMEGYKYLVD